MCDNHNNNYNSCHPSYPNNMKGEKGQKGDLGLKGETGCIGPYGPIGCKGEKGMKGTDGSKGENSNPFHGTTIDVLNKHSDYGTCSMKGSRLISHQSNEFDTGVSSSDNGHALFKIGLPNIIKLRLQCEAGGTGSPAVAGIINQDCHTSAYNWIQVDVFHYSRVVTLYEKYTQVLCKCGRPNTPISIFYSGAASGTNEDDEPQLTGDANDDDIVKRLSEQLGL